jgi:hypothetical protein
MTGFLRRGYVLGIVVALILSGCVPIPVPSLGYSSDSRTNLPDRVPGFIVKGKTTREEVLLGLGAPDSYAPDGRWIAYQSARHTGGVAFLVGGGYSAGVVGPVSSYEKRLLVVRFDANSIVIDAALEERTCLSASDAACSAVPDLSEDSKPELSALRSFYVAKAEPEAQDINLLVVAELRRRGRGQHWADQRALMNVDAIFTYRTDWKGDTTADLAFWLLPFDTGSDNAQRLPVRADARAPKTPTDMVAEAVASLFRDSANVSDFLAR